MLDRIEMSEKEIRRFELLRQVMDGVVSQQAAAQLLGPSASPPDISTLR